MPVKIIHGRKYCFLFTYQWQIQYLFEILFLILIKKELPVTVLHNPVIQSISIPEPQLSKDWLTRK